MMYSEPKAAMPKYYPRRPGLDYDRGLGEPFHVWAWENSLWRRQTGYARQGVLWHSTGAHNQKLSRYVQPCDGQNNFGRECHSQAEMMWILGRNPNGNDWCHGRSGTDCSVHAFIGKTAIGTVEACQIYDWTAHVNGAGSSLTNNGWIQIEMCDYCYDEQIYADACIEEGC